MIFEIGQLQYDISIHFWSKQTEWHICVVRIPNYNTSI